MSRARTLTDMLNDMMNQGLKPQQQQQLGQGQGQLGNLPYWTTTGTQLDPAQILKILQGYTGGLTADEQKEFSELKKQHEADIKTAKLSVFKKLASELRQYVINSYEWKSSVHEINQTKAEKSERLRELENKESLTRGYGGASLGSYHAGFSPEYKLNLELELPEGLTIEDLKQAHMEACLEEEMLNVQE